jgi:uncharacterized protein with HEPN domain
MRSESWMIALRDIERHIELAQKFVENFDLQSFENDLRTVFAVIRCLEVISEASRRLPDELKLRHGEIEWRKVAGAGNIYRHDYEDVAAQFVWDTVQLALPVLLSVVRDELRRQ